MPVTELAFLPSITPGEVPAPLLSEGTAALEAQDRWCRENFTTSITATSTSADGTSTSTGEGEEGRPTTTTTTTTTPWQRESRGAALFRQRGDGADGGVVLVTAHWDSPEQHHAWIASAANGEVMRRLVPLVRAEDVVFFHVAGVEMFPDADEDGGGDGSSRGKPTTLGAPVVSVTRVRVGAGGKEAFERGFERVRGAGGGLDGLARPFSHRGGWRIERGADWGEGEEEFVLVGGWESGEKAAAWAEGKGKGFEACFGALGELVRGVDVKTYERIL